MWIKVLFLLQIFISYAATKAVNKDSKHVTFQGYDEVSEIPIIPKWYAISGSDALKASGQVYNYKPTAAKETVVQRITNVPSVPYDISKHYGQYDLSYHDNLEYVFTTKHPDPVKQKVKGKKPQRSKIRKEKVTTKPSPKPAVFEEDEVFVENPKQTVKTQSRNTKKPLTKNPPKHTSAETSKQNFKPNTPKKTLVVTQSSMDHSLILVSSSSKIQNENENSQKPKISTKARTIVNTVELPDEDVIQDMTIPNDLIDPNESNRDELSLNLEKELEKFQSKPESGVGRNIQNVDLSTNEEDKRLMNDDVSNLFDIRFSSFVFNPQAQPQEKFQECATRKNESGHCRYVQHCMLPSILSSIQQFMDNVCIIQERFIGVCCPEFPADTLHVKWQDDRNSTINDEPVETPEECGIGSTKRIVGGTNADRKAWPWMVALLNSKNQFFCGGSLINNRYVLTASHCTFGPSDNKIVARLGEYDFNDSREPHDDYQVVEIKRHGQYTRITLRNDIALLKLDRPVIFNEFVKTVCLPRVEESFLDKTATLVGWGHVNGGSPFTGLSRRSAILQEASFPIIDNNECAKAHGIPVTPSLICAAATEKDKGACNGDSGGPLMLLDDEEHWKVIGVVSWGRRGCSPTFPTVYTRVTHYMDWIKKHAV